MFQLSISGLEKHQCDISTQCQALGGREFLLIIHHIRNIPDNKRKGNSFLFSFDR